MSNPKPVSGSSRPQSEMSQSSMTMSWPPVIWMAPIAFLGASLAAPAPLSVKPRRIT